MGKIERISKDEYYLNIALDAAARGTCLRRNYGAVIVNNDEVISTGYSGAPRGMKNCIDVGDCEREKMGIPSGENYDLCHSVHAEMNAIISASRRDMLDGVMYVAGVGKKSGKVVNTEPCRMCKKMIINAGLEKVITMQADYRKKTFMIKKWVKDGFIFPKEK